MTEHLEGDGLSRTRAFRLLSHAYRRALVDCLAGREGGLALADAAEEVAVRNGEWTRGRTPPGEVASVYAALHHCHLPQLVEAGAVDHDRERNVIALTGAGERLADVRETVAELGRDPVAAPGR